ncbi:hypothetical protein D3C76_1431530 [compost metagenome]
MGKQKGRFLIGEAAHEPDQEIGASNGVVHPVDMAIRRDRLSQVGGGKLTAENGVVDAFDVVV